MQKKNVVRVRAAASALGATGPGHQSLSRRARARTPHTRRTDRPEKRSTIGKTDTPRGKISPGKIGHSTGFDPRPVSVPCAPQDDVFDAGKHSRLVDCVLSFIIW